MQNREYAILFLKVIIYPDTTTLDKPLRDKFLFAVFCPFGFLTIRQSIIL
jgi:hypothetical protein